MANLLTCIRIICSIVLLFCHPFSASFYVIYLLAGFLGFPIDHSFLTYKKELKEYGFDVGKISMREQTIEFTKEQ